jgi:uncharacterized repeat protein (TIGR01451 family)
MQDGATNEETTLRESYTVSAVSEIDLASYNESLPTFQTYPSSTSQINDPSTANENPIAVTIGETSSSNQQSPFSGENVNIIIGTLPSGKSVTITFNVTVDDPFPPANNPACNQATITSNELSPVLTDDPDAGTADDPTCTTIDIEADLSITKTNGATTEIPGTSVIYTIVASNAGPSNDPSATVADTFPAAITGVTWTCVSAGGATCTAVGAGNINDTANLPAGGSVTYTASGTISASATGTLVNTATVTSSVTDPNAANNSATDTDTLMPEADVSITKTDGQASDIPGTSIAYNIVASNAGPSNAPGSLVADTFPAALTGVAWTCSGAGSSVTYIVNNTIDSGATGVVSNTATVTEPGGVTDQTRATTAPPTIPAWTHRRKSPTSRSRRARSTKMALSI